MTIASMHLLVGQAVVSERFCAGLLNGRRADLLDRFEFSTGEHSALMSVEARTLPEFAAAVERLIASVQPVSSPTRWTPSTVPAIWSMAEQPVVRSL